MNNKGFTLVEVLATFVLMAIILGIAFPAIDNLYKENNTQIYETYENSLKTAAKLYVDQYDVDLWKKGTNGCIKLEFKDIKCEGLIKDFNGRNKSEEIDISKTYVYAIKKDGRVSYQVYMYTKKKNSNTKIYETKPAPTATGCLQNPIKDYCTNT